MPNLIEAAALAPESLTGKSWRVKLIEGDRQGSSAYYPKEVLESGRALYKKGTRIYADHRAEGERPERSIRNLIGWFTEDAEYDGKDLHTSVSFVESERERIKELAEAGVIGLSISAEGKFKKGTKILESFTRVHSVDVVTVPGAGGSFEQVLESEGSDGTAVPGSQKEESPMDPKELAAALAEALAPKFAELTEALKPAPVEAKPLEEAKPEKVALADFLAKLDEAELTKTGRAAVTKVYEDGGDFAAAIEAETAREAEIAEAKGAGFKGAVSNEADGSKALTEALGSIWA